VTRLNDLVELMTDKTYGAQGPILAKRRYVYASYVDEPVMMVTGASTKHYFHQNHLYSVAAMTNSAGAVVERYRYDAYGKRTVTNAAGTPIAASTIGQQRGFTGYHLDAETGLYYARARMYSAGLGRFVSRDPCMVRKVAQTGVTWNYQTSGMWSWMRPIAGDGYQDGMSLYGAWFAPNAQDPYGLNPKPKIQQQPKPAPKGAVTITTPPCSVVVHLDHGDGSGKFPHGWVFGQCSAGATIGCGSAFSNNLIPAANQAGGATDPDGPFGEDTLGQGPDWWEEVFRVAGRGGTADAKAMALCSCDCSIVTVFVTGGSRPREGFIDHGGGSNGHIDYHRFYICEEKNWYY